MTPDQKPKVNGASEIAENALDNLLVMGKRALHELADFVDCKGELRSRDGHVLECTRSAPIKRRRIKFIMTIGSEIDPGSHMRGHNALCCVHIHSIQEIRSILFLRQENTTRDSMNLNAKKIV